MVSFSRKVRRILQPHRLFAFALIFGCLFHIHQIYLDSIKTFEHTRHKNRRLFLFPKRSIKRSKVSDDSITTKSERRNDSCEPRKSILFLKTHKTGSTTVTNIILRYAYKHRLIVGLPPSRHWQLGGYPASFDSKIILPQLNQYDVLCHHLRYNHKAVRKVLPTNAVAITILRDPADGFESGFAFFRDWPYSQWFENISKPENLQLFLNKPNAYYNSSTPWHFRSKNYMAFDLGFDHNRNDLEYGNMAIRIMEEWFDLVLTTDRMDECLILLKEILCMESFDDIIYLRLKVRQDFARREVTPKMKVQMRDWNFLDSTLYNHFNRTLDRKIDLYGREKMEKELKEFRKLLEETEKKCVKYYDKYHMKPWVSRIKLRENSGDFCEKVSWGEVKFGDFLRTYQKSYVKTGRIHQPSREEIELLLSRAQESVIGSEAVGNSA